MHASASVFLYYCKLLVQCTKCSDLHECSDLQYVKVVTFTINGSDVHW